MLGLGVFLLVFGFTKLLEIRRIKESDCIQKGGDVFWVKEGLRDGDTFLVRGKKASNFILKENRYSRIRREKDRTKPKWIEKAVEGLQKRDLEKGISCVARQTKIKMDLFKLKRKKGRILISKVQWQHS